MMVELIVLTLRQFNGVMQRCIVVGRKGRENRGTNSPFGNVGEGDRIPFLSLALTNPPFPLPTPPNALQITLPVSPPLRPLVRPPLHGRVRIGVGDLLCWRLSRRLCRRPQIRKRLFARNWQFKQYPRVPPLQLLFNRIGGGRLRRRWNERIDVIQMPILALRLLPSE